MRRRIEITVYRRATLAFHVQSGDKGGATPETRVSEPVSPVSAHADELENGEADFTTVDVSCSRELMLLIEALLRNDGSSTSAARDLGLSRSDFVSRLCGFAFGTKQ